MHVTDPSEPISVPLARQRADALALLPVDLSPLRLLASLPVRGRDALLACLLFSALAPAFLLLTLPSSWMLPLVALALAALLAFAGLRTSGAWRVVRLARQLSRRRRGLPTDLLDFVAFAQPCSLVSTRHAHGYQVSSLRLHDEPGSAISEHLDAQARPSWWSSASPASRSVFFDGFAVCRDGSSRASGVLVEAAVEHSRASSALPAGEPVRLVGNESTAVIFTSSHVVIWPRGRWLAGG